MQDFLPPKSAFLQKVVAVIEDNLGDENFGVTELAELIGMSRSNLLRKVKQETEESVSVLIRNVRLQKSKALLQDESLTVSEVAYKVGFSSTSYFTKCFRELYGYTPGEEGGRAKQKEELETTEVGEIIEPPTEKAGKVKLILSVLVAVVGVIVTLFFMLQQEEKTAGPNLRKSIAVLPFKNDSSDSSNVYFMNGLMESILDNFQKIEDIKVTSRTTVEKYRGVSKTMPELSEELNVSYIIEGSGQKIGDEILLNIQLVEAATDQQLWTQSYKRKVEDVFQIQMEVAKSIASEINAIITPEEQERIEKIPTQNLVAYDYYLKGLAYMREETGEGLIKGIEQLKKAIQEDGQFAHAYAYMAIAYYYLDIFQIEKKHIEELKNYTDKALLLDDKLGESLIAKALYYTQVEEFETAISTFEEALVYYPNVGWMHNFLSDLYATRLPNTEKYLEHALKGIHSKIAEEDSASSSISYLHLSNALAQTGFIKESETYIQKSITLDANNLFSQYVYVYIRLAQHFDLEKAKNSLIDVLQKDTTRFDVIQEIAKVCYTMEDYEEAWAYYDKMVTAKKALQLDIYKSEDIKIGFTLRQLGEHEKAEEYFDSYLEYAQSDESLYKDLSLSAYYATMGDTEKAMEYLKAFSKQENYQYWIVLFLDKDPIIRQMSGHPDYQKTLQKIDDRFWAKYQQLRLKLEKEGVFPSE
ncbi:helix-turn-helix domain-containing protein [Flammeovirgaceae bacterium SG7u.111]|nr:helix-turn-helix domain-containing protein [Flammeovirgaceae bacterium SG7u.132]WPO37977.1 helix-turn-helix domain-containing protein [Flammeovirgaceae bacterium SG7u.111]